jgi:hypothetical protein
MQLFLCAAVAKYGLGGNGAEEAFYLGGFTDANGKPLMGGSTYLIHFTPAQIPPVNPKGFWCITAYNSTQRLVPNPLNVYQVGVWNVQKIQ